MNEHPPPGLIRRICAEADRDGYVDVDPIDGSCWITMPSPAAATRTVTALTSHGIATAEPTDTGRIHSLGWDTRLLRIRLGTLLAGIDDLIDDFDTTTELTCYHYDRRQGTGRTIDPVDVMTDIENALRGALPLPHRTPRITDIDTLRTLAAAAEDAYQQLINQHLDHAEHILATRTAGRAADLGAD